MPKAILICTGTCWILSLLSDREMQYSCGYFTQADHSLEQAQQDKLEMICRKPRLQPSEKLLDIGSGWGGLICYAARHYKVKAHGVTLSQQQFDFTKEKIRRLGLEEWVSVELRDLRPSRAVMTISPASALPICSGTSARLIPSCVTGVFS